MIWVNFKIYKEAFGDGALKLAKTCRQVSEKTKVKIVPVVSPFDVRRIKKEISGEVWIQHVDTFFEGAKTGWLSPLQAMAAGADGALINHSEHKLPPGQVRQVLAYLKNEKWQKHWKKEVGCSQLDLDNFRIMVCFRSKGQVKKWVARLKPRPDFVAYEPPELIGGDVSVSQAQPKAIKRIVASLSEHKVVIGAGIKTGEDIKKAMRLGAKGVLISSGVVKAEDPEKKLMELAKVFKATGSSKTK